MEDTPKLDPITRLITDINSEATTARVQAVKAKCKLSPEDRVSVLRAMTCGDDGSWLIDVVEHLRSMSFYDGLTEGINRASEEIGRSLAKYRDDGDGLPLARLGPGGDFTREVR